MNPVDIVVVVATVAVVAEVDLSKLLHKMADSIVDLPSTTAVGVVAVVVVGVLGRVDVCYLRCCIVVEFAVRRWVVVRRAVRLLGSRLSGSSQFVRPVWLFLPPMSPQLPSRPR